MAATVGLTLPPFNGWMLPDDAGAFLADLVVECQPRLILEVGSGRSTLWLAAALRDCGDGWLVSLEHQEAFVVSTEEMLRENRLSEYAQVRYAPLEPHRHEADLLAPEWYASSAWADLLGIGLLFVDGPPGNLSPFSRAPALPLLRDRLLPSAVVILDDTCRRAEQRIVREWGIEMTYVPHSTGALSYGNLP